MTNHFTFENRKQYYYNVILQTVFLFCVRLRPGRIVHERNERTCITFISKFGVLVCLHLIAFS